MSKLDQTPTLASIDHDTLTAVTGGLFGMGAGRGPIRQWAQSRWGQGAPAQGGGQAPCATGNCGAAQ